MKNICIFTTFNDADPAYSLNRVVQDQIKMLLMNDYKVKVIVADNFQPIEMYKEVEIAKIPIVPCHNEVKKDETFDQDVDNIEIRLREVLKDVKIVITHDIVYQPAALKHNFAARRIAEERKDIKWLHWIHSATSPFTLNQLMNIFSDKYIQLVQKPFPNSFYIFFNHYSIPRIAKNFNVPEPMVKVVPHPTDYCGFLGFDKKTAKLVYEKNMLSADAICCYPIRLDRGKQVEYVIKTMAKLKEFDMGVRIIIVDFHSTGGDKVVYRDELKNIAIDNGLNAQEITFTSEVCDEWKLSVPHKVVRDFMLLSNVFIMPSVSESYSLITQEFALAGKGVLVLNGDFPPFRDIFGPTAIYRKYSSAIDMMTGFDGWTKTEYGANNISKGERKFAENSYHKDTAGMIAYHLRNDIGIQMHNYLRKNRNLQTVFKKHLEPLFYG